MDTPENPQKIQPLTPENIKSEVQPESGEGTGREITGPELREHASAVESDMNRQASEVKSEAEQRVDLFANSMEIPQEMVRQTMTEVGLDLQLNKIQAEAGSIADKAESEVEEVVGERKKIKLIGPNKKPKKDGRGNYGVIEDLPRGDFALDMSVTPDQNEGDFTDNSHLKGYLLNEFGDINKFRLNIVRDRFGDAVKGIDGSLEGYINLQEKFSEACNICLNAIEISDDPEKSDRIFNELGKFLNGAPDFMPDTDRRIVFERIVGNFPKIKTCVEDGKTEGLSCIVSILKKGDNSQIKAGAEFITENLPGIKNTLVRSSFKDEQGEYDLGMVADEMENAKRVASVAEVIFINGKDRQKEKLCKTMELALLDPKTAPNAAAVMGNLFRHFDIAIADEQEEKERRGTDILKGTFRQLGMTQSMSKDLIEDWTKDSEKREVFVEENLERVLQIEAARPGSAELLFQRFGIMAFGRYPESMLINQYDNRDNDSVPYGVVLYPRDDWNGAFHQEYKMFSDLSDGLSNPNGNPEFNKHLMRVFECGSKKDIVQALIGCGQSYVSHKISFAIIGGHGEKDSIQFGSRESRRNSLFSRDLRNRRAKKTSDFFEPGAPIVLVSCSTGKNEGIGQTLSEEFGTKVIAPTEPTNVDRIKPVFKNGKIDFDVAYFDRETKAVFAPKS